MTAPELDAVLNKLTCASSCCHQLAQIHGGGDEANALHFVGNGIEAVADEIRGWINSQLKATDATKQDGPVAVP